MLNKTPIPQRRQNSFIVLFLILLITWLCYFPSLFYDFVNWDDAEHVLNNSLARSLSPANILRIFRSTTNKTYIPLTTLSFAVDYQVVRYSPFFYHLHNVCLHLVVTALVFLLSRRMRLTLGSATIASLLFALHPLHVESVAWVTQRKDVLYATFYMLALISYWSYLNKQRSVDYWLAVFWGFLGMLAKPMALSLPLVLLVFDWFSGRRITGKVWLAKIPFLVYILPIAGITFLLNTEVLSFNLRLSQAILAFLWSLTFYPLRFLFPVTLSPINELPQPVLLHHPAYALAVVACLASIMWLGYFHKNRWVIFSFLYYFASIFFLLRFNNVSHIGIVNDRFMYLPSLGFCLLAGKVIAGGEGWVSEKRSTLRVLGLLAIVFLFVGLFFRASSQIRIWENGGTLWRHVLKIYPQNSRANNNLADYLLKQGWLSEEVAVYCQKAMMADPQFSAAYVNWGTFLARQGKLEKAAANFQKALQLDPDNPVIQANLGTTLYQQGKFPEALGYLKRAIDLGFINNNLLVMCGKAGLASGEGQIAEQCYQKILERDPYSVEAKRDLKLLREKMRQE